MSKLFNRKMPKAKPSKMQTVTLNGFGGGWNSIDDDISMQSRFLKTCTNTFRVPGGGQVVRFGTRFIMDITPYHDSPIVDMDYYNNSIIIVTSDGWLLAMDAANSVTTIWNPTISATRFGAPGIWTAGTTSVSFVHFKDKLAIHNGKDKPLQIDSTFKVDYLQDAGSGSNVNVPIGKYGCTAGNYQCVAGIPLLPTTVYITSQGTFGTFPGDPAPNDSISIDVGAYAPEGAAEIRGLSGYRNFLIVHMQGISLQVKLGTYNNAATPIHTPEFPDSFPKFGLVGNRCKAVVENDLIFAGVAGLGSASRNIYSGNLVSDYLSSKIENEYRRIIGALSTTSQKEYTFSVHDPLSNCFMIITNGNEAIIYISNNKEHYKSWAKFTGWDWSCGCTSFLGRVYFAKGKKIYQYGNRTFGEIYNADKMDDRDKTWAVLTTFANGELVYDAIGNKIYTCRVSHTTDAVNTFAYWRDAYPTYWTEYTGIPISFELEQPWFSGREPMQLKFLKYLSMATKGSGEYTIEAYVDNLFKDESSNWLTDENGAQIEPQLQMQFVGNDARGFGTDTGPYGGGRRSRDPRLYKFPVKFKAVKFRITGSTTRYLEFINMSFMFVRGKYSR